MSRPPQSPPIDDVVALLDQAVDPDVLERGRRRQEAVWLGKTPDYLPLLLGYLPARAGGLGHDRRFKHAEHELVGGEPTAELERYPHYTLVEQYHDPCKMLYEALWDMVGWARAKSDAQLSVRNNFLQWALASACGMTPHFDEVETPWAIDHLDKSALRRLEVDGMEQRGLLPRSLEFIEYINGHLPPHVHQYLPGVSGPLCFANYLFGDSWFWMDMFDDPQFIHDALDFCTEVHRYMGHIYKRAIGADGTCAYDGSLYMAGNGLKVVDDSSVLISPQQHAEFVLPRLARCFENFGTGWYHCCGNFADKLDQILEIPKLRAVNFGNPEMWDQDDAVARIVKAGKVYYGGWGREPDEPLESYLRRAILIAGPEKRGLIIMLHETHGQPLPHPERIMELWHRLQDEGA